MMSPALQKLKAKLFTRFTPEAIGVDPTSESLIEPRPPNVGGLGYKITGLRHSARVEIQHSNRDIFHITIFVSDDLFGERVRISSLPIQFKHIDEELRRLIGLVRAE